MTFVISLFAENPPYMQWPGLSGLLIWIISVLLMGWVLWRNRELREPWNGRQWQLFILLYLSTFIFSLFIGFEFPLADQIPIPGELGSKDSYLWLIFSAVPWALAAGLLGPFASFSNAITSGLLISVFYTHRPFTVIEYALVGMILGFLINQPYRTNIYRWIRNPLLSAVLLSVAYPVLFLFGVLLQTAQDLPDLLNYALQVILPASIVFGASLLVAGMASVIVRGLVPGEWGAKDVYAPSPSEKSLEKRLLYLMGWMVGVVMLALAVLGGIIAFQTAQQIVEERMSAAANLSAENVPRVLEVGQNLIQENARDPGLSTGNEAVIADLLQSFLSNSLYYNQYLVVSQENAIIAAADRGGIAPSFLSLPEEAGVELALQGVPFQYYTTVLQNTESNPFVSFIVPIQNAGRVLIARSSIIQNPFATPLLTSLQNLADIKGQGMLVDENGLIIYHSTAAMISTIAGAEYMKLNGFEQVTSPSGQQIKLLSQSAAGRNWKVYIEAPVAEIHQLAFRIAAPPLALLVLLAVVSIVLLRFTLRFVTDSLRKLAFDASKIASNPENLSRPLASGGGIDEVGIMRRAFERMRMSLKARMDEQAQLLQASHGAASSLDFSVAVRPLLEAALTHGAVSARVVLSPGAFTGDLKDSAQTYSAGPSRRNYEYLDSQILHKCRESSPIVIEAPHKDSSLRVLKGRAIPRTILGVAMKNRDWFYGCLWLAYHEPHHFSESEIRFLTTLALQGALTAENVRLFKNAEAERERLGEIIASIPDPVIVTDSADNLLLANTAALEILGAINPVSEPLPIDGLLNSKLVDVIKSDASDDDLIEFEQPNGKTYRAKVTSVIIDERKLGRIAIMRDVSDYKELDKMKSDFVQTASHDIRAPLSLATGYVKMIPLVGELNEEQNSIVEKIVAGLGSAREIVENLLDLGKIESGIQLDLELISSRQLGEEIIAQFQPIAAQKNITLEFKRKGTRLPAVEIDSQLFARALMNLIDNAIKYTPRGGKVSLMVAPDEDESKVRFVISDNGIGIDKNYHSKLFDKFFRVRDRRSHKQSGSGLGLAIVRSIVERHHGQISVQSEPGVGSKFIILIPEDQPEEGYRLQEGAGIN